MAALSRSEGFSRPVPSAVLGVALVLSVVRPALRAADPPRRHRLRRLVGIGALGTAAYGVAWLGEPATAARIGCLVLIVSGVVGLKLVH